MTQPEPAFAQASTTLGCPACGGSNATDAVFCANTTCGKALGEFRYAVEEFHAAQRGLTRWANRIADAIGHPHFVTAHVAVFAGWLLVNEGRVPWLPPFDAYPYALLGTLLAIEAVLITSFLLISARQREHFDRHQSETQYDASVRSYRLLQGLSAELTALERRLAALEHARAPGTQAQDDGS